MKLKNYRINVSDKNSILLEKLKSQFFYGHREILLDYMGLGHNKVIGGVLQHGVFEFGINDPSSDIVIKTPIKSIKRFPLFVYSKSSKIALEPKVKFRVEAIGSPWIYLNSANFKSEGDKTCDNPCDKVLVFPSHHTLGGESLLDLSSCIEKIKFWKSLAQGKDICICLYWIEFMDPSWHQACLIEGVKMYNAGIGYNYPIYGKNMLRVNFMKRLFTIINSHSVILFEDISSAIFYAFNLKKTVGLFRSTRSFQNIPEQVTSIKMDNLIIKLMPQIIESFSNNTLYGEVSDELLGVNNKLSPEEMRRIVPTISGLLPY